MTLLAVWQLFTGENQTKAFGDLPLLRIDELSGFILLATSVFALLIAVYSLDYMKGKDGQRLYYASLLWSLAFSCGVLLANDLVLLLACWGLLAVTLYLMIGLAGPDASEAARKTLIIVGGSDALLLLGTALLWVQHGSTRMDVGALSPGFREQHASPSFASQPRPLPKPVPSRFTPGSRTAAKKRCPGDRLLARLTRQAPGDLLAGTGGDGSV